MDPVVKRAIDAALARAEASQRRTAAEIKRRFGASEDVQEIMRLAAAAGAELATAEVLQRIEPTLEQLLRLTRMLEE